MFCQRIKAFPVTIPSGIFCLPVIVCAFGYFVDAFGYFVDVYDIVIFSAVRMASLRAIGVPESEIFGTGAWLLNVQMVGMLLGGLLWGIIGDRKGRVIALFGSILLYSVANILNAWVQSVEQYAVLRFISGFGLAGEVGGAITLISEILPKDRRAYGIAVMGAIGLSGGVVSGFVAGLVDWQSAYLIGGVLGLVLLVLRWRVLDSAMFSKILAEKGIRRGSVRMLLWPPRRLAVYVSCIIIGIPVYYTVVVFMVFAPELTKSLQASGSLSPAMAVMWIYAGLPFGETVCSIFGQKIRSRRRAIASFLVLHMVTACIYLYSSPGMPVQWYYGLSFMMGFFGGFPMVLMNLAAEHFGTNLRATVTTSAINFVRAATIPITVGYLALKEFLPLTESALLVGLVCYVLAFIGLSVVEETCDRDLDYHEE